MDGNCNAGNVIYQAEVTTTTTKETYIALCDTSFKLRYRNHVCSFCNEQYKHANAHVNLTLEQKKKDDLLYQHFHGEGHLGLEDMSEQLIDWVKGEKELREKEEQWI